MVMFDADSGNQPTPPPADVSGTAPPPRPPAAPPTQPGNTAPPVNVPPVNVPPVTASPPPQTTAVAGGQPASRGDGFWTRPGGARRPENPSEIPRGNFEHEYAEQAAAWDDEAGELVESAKQNAPAWLASSVLHVSLMLILALWAFNETAEPRVELTALVSELPGEQLIEEVSLDTADAPDDEQALSISPLDEIDDPLSAPPIIDNLIGEASLAPEITAPNIGNTFEGRDAGSKAAILGKYGASDGSENAVSLGLAWLARQQQADGSWSLLGPYPDGSFYEENTVAATAMAMLAFQGAGHTHQDKSGYQRNLYRALKYLLKLQKADGDFYFVAQRRQDLNDAHLYSHAQAAIAVCELYAMTKDPELRAPAQRAIDFCIEAQDPDYGGWRYNPGRARDSDVSVTGWMLMALQSARIAGLDVDSGSLARASQFLDLATVEPRLNRFVDGSRYAYMPGGPADPTMTAEALLCRQYLGWRRDDERMQAGVAYLSEPRQVPTWVDRNVYKWYYTTQTLHNYSGPEWRAWNDVMRDLLVDHQSKNGKNQGSWHPLNPDPDKFAREGGRLYVTCLSIYILEVYYRHLPIYGSAAH